MAKNEQTFKIAPGQSVPLTELLGMRIQLSRKRGFCMPDNTKKVDRSTKFGNPFQADSKTNSDRVVEMFKQWLLGDDEIIKKYPDLEDKRMVLIASLTELKGKNLACWCHPGNPCHADVLLAIANAVPNAL